MLRNTSFLAYRWGRAEFDGADSPVGLVRLGAVTGGPPIEQLLLDHYIHGAPQTAAFGQAHLLECSLPRPFPPSLRFDS